MVGQVKFEARIKELVENTPDLAVLVEPLLIVRRALREQIVVLHRRLLAVVRDDEVCRRLITTPGVGPVVALTYRATVDVPARFLSRVRRALPVCPQLPTYRCVALSDVQGQHQTTRYG